MWSSRLKRSRWAEHLFGQGTDSYMQVSRWAWNRWEKYLQICNDQWQVLISLFRGYFLCGFWGVFFLSFLKHIIIEEKIIRKKEKHVYKNRWFTPDISHRDFSWFQLWTQWDHQLDTCVSDAMTPTCNVCSLSTQRQPSLAWVHLIRLFMISPWTSLSGYSWNIVNIVIIINHLKREYVWSGCSWDTPACCWDVKQPTNQPTNKPSQQQLLESFCCYCLLDKKVYVWSLCED